MESDSSLLVSMMRLFLFAFIYAFFTMCEVSAVALSDKKLEKMAEDGDKKAGMILRLVQSPSKFTATIRIGLVLSSFFMAVIVTGVFLPRYTKTLGSIMPHSAAFVFSFVLVTLVYLVFSIVLGYMVPRKIAVHYYEKIAFSSAYALGFLSFLFRPLAALFSFFSGLILRLFGIDPDSEPAEVTEEEIRLLLDEGGERGSIEESEKEMINNIFELDDSTVEDIMTHRTEIVHLRLDAPLMEIIETALKTGYSRIPVCEENSVDQVVGILYVKDLLALKKSGGTDEDFSLQNYIREPLYILESHTCMAALSEFKAKKIHMAIIVDEYGGTSGLVTMEDLLEFIVGSIEDEYDVEEDEDISMISENMYLVDGLTSLEDIDKYFRLKLSDTADFDTIGGYVIDLLGRIPSDGEHPGVEIHGYRFIVNEMDERRVVSLNAEKITDPLKESAKSDDTEKGEAPG